MFFRRSLEEKNNEIERGRLEKDRIERERVHQERSEPQFDLSATVTVPVTSEKLAPERTEIIAQNEELESIVAELKNDKSKLKAEMAGKV